MISMSTRVIRAPRRSEQNSPRSPPPSPRPSCPPATETIAVTDAPTGKKGESSRVTDQPVPKRRRKSSPSSATPQPGRTPEPAAAPRQPITKPAKLRPSASAFAPTRTTTAILREEARQSRVTSPSNHDEPATPLAPRVGMGEVYPPPPESDIRTEAQYIIQAAARHRELEQLRKQREQPIHVERTNGGPRITPPPSGGPAYPNPHQPANGGSLFGTPASAENGYPTELYYATAGPSTYTAQSGPGPSTFSRRRSDTPSYRPTDKHFKVRDGAIQSSYGDRAAADTQAPAPQTQFQNSTQSDLVHSAIVHDEPKPPRFHEGQRPTIVLAPPGGNRAKAKDKMDKAHQEGFEGLTAELEADALGFVENVRVSAIIHMVASPLTESSFFLSIALRHTSLGSDVCTINLSGALFWMAWSTGEHP